MRQFKVYTNLTVGYNFAIILACVFGLTLNFSAPNTAWATGGTVITGAEEATPPAAEAAAQPQAAATDTAAQGAAPTGQQVINVNTTPQLTPEEKLQKACDDNNKDINDRISKMTSACSATKLGTDCVSKLFKCHSGQGDSDECKKIREQESADTRSELDNKIEGFKKEKEKLEKAEEKLKEDLDKAQSEIEDLKGQQEDVISEKRLAEEALKEKLAENKSEAATHAEKLQAGIEALQQKIRELHVATMEDSNAMTNLIATSRIECIAEGREKASTFVTKMRTCTQRGGNCGVRQSTIYAMGKRSLEDLGNELQKRHVRKCMSVSGNNAFGVKYMALQSQIARKTEFLNAQRAELLNKQTQLQAQIQTIPTQNSIKDTQSMIEKAQADQGLTQKEQQLMMKQLQAAAKVKAIQEKIEKEKQKVDEVNTKIAKAEKAKASALNDDDLKRFKEAMAGINDIKSLASDNLRGCGCESAIKTVNSYVGGICDGTSADATSGVTTTE
ncbi:MAG: hypothetical protein M9899_00515 [Bdellovibrionaceae bacterium]|nr:hypothetical protein [Pseudobdellovibrionaceae bacterium]